RSAAMLVVVLRGGDLIPLACVITGFNALENFALALAVRYYLHDLRLSPALVTMETFREIRGYSISAVVQSLAYKIAFQTDAIVIAMVLGPGAITNFTIANKLIGYAKSSLRSMTQVLTPTISAMDARGDQEAIRRIMLTGSRYVLWLV